MVLGAIWAKDHWGRYWGWAVKEVGGLAVLSWLLVGLAMQWCKVGTHATMILSVGGNIVVALAWFGANLLVHGVGSNGVSATKPLTTFHRTRDRGICRCAADCFA